MSEFGKAATEGKRISARGVIAIIILIIAVVFMAQNTTDVTIKVIGYSFEVWLWALILVVFLLGMFLGGAVRAGVRKLRGVEKAPK
ncbi:MAG: DUF1049 domain-containing protein [Actinobacteria bacterium]|jgi:uncharacterized integral membrane protein|uniref:Unannotated protein n=1 Tax=freshwater metagenome TaxID=449393 RepID=A0A6J7IK73_9ZZZZ|nr:DUF1049 domain-containing protein [Actinomycetota bacterium]